MADQTHEAIRMLEQQHREIEELFDRFADTEDAQKRRQLFESLADHLVAHTRIEEELFYPAVMDDENEEMLREAVEEHLGIKRLIADLLGMSPEDEQFDAKMELIEDILMRHVEKEEEALFGRVRKDVEREALLEIGERMHELYRELMDGEPRHAVVSQIGSAAHL
jgi:hemerythrin superfamily protein